MFDQDAFDPGRPKCGIGWANLVGTANPENIKKNVAWANEPIDWGLLDEVKEILAPIHNRTWPSGLPENN